MSDIRPSDLMPRPAYELTLRDHVHNTRGRPEVERLGKTIAFPELARERTIAVQSGESRVYEDG
jgi:hypothetical protein